MTEERPVGGEQFPGSVQEDLQEHGDQAPPAGGPAPGASGARVGGKHAGGYVEEDVDQAVDQAADQAATTETVEPGTAAEGGLSEEQEAEQVEDELTLTRRAVDELTGDLQRLQAEFVNYKRRVERDRDLIRENATYAALTPIIDVLDTIDRAREHGELDGGLKTVAEQLERVVAGLGLTKFGRPGEAFDPTVHEALSHIGEDPEVEVTTCKVIAKAGYRINDRVVRAAQVLVVDPPSGPTQ